MTTIYKGDDTDAFDSTKITIKLKGADSIQISKAIFRCGNIQKSYTRPVFPLVVNFTSQETERMWDENECYLQIFDTKGRRQTCRGDLTIRTQATE